MSALNVNDTLLKSIQDSLSPDAIRAAMEAEAQKQGLVRDPATGAYVKDPVTVAAEEKKAADDAAAAKAEADRKLAEDAAKGPQVFKQELVLNGKTFIFEGDSELDVQRQINNALIVARETQPETQVAETVVDEPVVDPAKEAAARAELELKFKNGEITPQEYLEKSGAFESYLASKGLSIEAVKEAVDDTQVAKVQQSWAEATEEFLNSPVGADWPGGEKNKYLIGMQLQNLGLSNATDKVAALAQAYAAMKNSGMVFPNEELIAKSTADKAAADAQVKAAAEAAAAKAQADIAAQTAYRQAEIARQNAENQRQQELTRRTSSSLFGASSGTSTNDIKERKNEPQAVSVDPTASPEMILEAWKNGLRQNGIDPNAAFMEAFAAPRKS